jgi:FAD/FMN-containing dehydrogenase
LRLPVLRRQRWLNHTGNQGVDPVELRTPTDPDELKAAIATARRQHLTVRMVGSGHSWSDVAITTGILLLPHGLTGVEAVPQSLLRSDEPADRLFWVKSGTTIRELNAELDGRGRALKQMGGYDGQTIAGAVSTSTHGSGIRFGPFPNYVRSIDLVDGTGRMRRIEPAGGPSDPGAPAAQRQGWELSQDDDEFYAAVCGMGSMGLIVSLMIEVREKFELTEVRLVRRWDEVRREIRSPLESGPLGENEHYEFYINPYARNGEGSNRCIVTTRNQRSGDGGSRHRPPGPELLGKIPWFTAGLMQLAGQFAPERIPWLLDFSLGAIKCPGGYTNVSYDVFNIGSVNNLRAYSAEMEVPTEGDRHIDAIERVLDVAARYRAEGKIYHTSPIACRFVARSGALMSMMHDRETMTIELIQLVDTAGGTEILAAHEEALAAVDVRPHWGQINSLANAQLRSYPALARWEAVRRKLDPHGVFASPFTKRVGITSRGVSS